MTFEEWAGPEPPRESESWYRWEYKRDGWDAAVAEARVDILQAKLEETEKDLDVQIERTESTRSELEAAHADVRDIHVDLMTAKSQWGDQYLWRKFGLDDALSKPSVRKIVEET